MTNSFFPQEDYKLPETSNFFKLTEGEHTFRIMSPSVIGYEYFTTENKPVRSKEPFDDTPNMKSDGQVKHFWAFIIWNRNAKRIQIMEVSQKSIMTPMKALIDNIKWGNPVNKYDITITRKGTTKNDTEYSVMPNPAEPNDDDMNEVFMNTPVNLEALFSGADPFAK